MKSPLIRYSGAMRSIELWCAIAHLRISMSKTTSRFRVRLFEAPRNDEVEALPHQLLHRTLQTLDRDRIHAIGEQAADDGGGFRIVPVPLRDRIEPHGVRIGADHALEPDRACLFVDMLD